MATENKKLIILVIDDYRNIHTKQNYYWSHIHGNSNYKKKFLLVLHYQ